MIQTLESYPIEIDEDFYLFSPQSFFSEANALEVEIGCGKGRFLAETAIKYPDKYFLGVESAHAFAHLAEDRICRRQLKNVRIMDWSAETFLPFFKSESVSRFHIYFPDPWPKKKHHKRRIWKEDFLDLLNRLLTQDGKIYFASDHADYFEIAVQLIESGTTPFALERREEHRFFEGAADMTSYEKKFELEGRKLNYASFVKK